jgi:predicted nuclease with TOPRIM domain
MGYKKKTTTSNAETQQIIPEPAPEPIPVISDEERKQIIANKRRETLAKAREMRTPKHEIRKQAQETIQNKDELIKSKEEVIKTKDEIIKTKEQELGQTKQDIENNRIKMLEDNVIMMKKLLSDKTPPVEVVKPKRIYKPKELKPKPAQQPQQPQQPQPQQPTTDTLIDKSYREQLQERLREQVFNKIMKDTFS